MTMTSEMNGNLKLTKTNMEALLEILAVALLGFRYASFVVTMHDSKRAYLRKTARGEVS